MSYQYYPHMPPPGAPASVYNLGSPQFPSREADSQRTQVCVTGGLASTNTRILPALHGLPASVFQPGADNAYLRYCGAQLSDEPPAGLSANSEGLAASASAAVQRTQPSARGGSGDAPSTRVANHTVATNKQKRGGAAPLANPQDEKRPRPTSASGKRQQQQQGQQQGQQTRQLSRKKPAGQQEPQPTNQQQQQQTQSPGQQQEERRLGKQRVRPFAIITLVFNLLAEASAAAPAAGGEANNNNNNGDTAPARELDNADARESAASAADTATVPVAAATATATAPVTATATTTTTSAVIVVDLQAIPQASKDDGREADGESDTDDEAELGELACILYGDGDGDGQGTGAAGAAAAAADGPTVAAVPEAIAATVCGFPAGGTAADGDGAEAGLTPSMFLGRAVGDDDGNGDVDMYFADFGTDAAALSTPPPCPHPSARVGAEPWQASGGARVSSSSPGCCIPLLHPSTHRQEDEYGSSGPLSYCVLHCEPAPRVLWHDGLDELLMGLAADL